MLEFKASGWLNDDGTFKDGMQEAICNHVLKLLEVFSDEGHSGTSAPYAVDLFSKLALFKPLVPLTGEDWEWYTICDDRTNNVTIHQNTRASNVFKQSDRYDGKPYDIEGKVFWEWRKHPDDDTPFKSYFTSADSFVVIEFPYTPEREYVFVPSEEFPNEVLS